MNLLANPAYHVLTPFSRPQSAQFLTDWLRGEGVIWHPLPHEDFAFSNEDWIKPRKIVVGPGWEKSPSYDKINNFKEWVDEDYYCFMADDEVYQRFLFRKLAAMGPTEDVVVISADFGDHVVGDPPYPAMIYKACPENMIPCMVDCLQYLVKGRIMRDNLIPDNRVGDGLFAQALKEKGYSIRYEPNLYGLFNYLQTGRFNPSREIAKPII